MIIEKRGVAGCEIFHISYRFLHESFSPLGRVNVVAAACYKIYANSSGEIRLYEYAYESKPFVVQAKSGKLLRFVLNKF